MNPAVRRLLAVDEYPIALVDLAQVHVERARELCRQANRAPMPANAPVALVALLLPGQPDADRLPTCCVMIGRVPEMLEALILRIGGKAPQLRDIHVERRLRGRRPAQRPQHLRCVAVAERKDALVGVGVAWMIVEAELDALAMQPAQELIGVRYERAPVVTTLPSVVVPGEIQHQRIERNLVLAEP